MGEPVATMPWTDDVSRALRRASKRRPGPRRDGAYAFLDQRPRGLDGIEVVRVRREKPERRPGILDQVPHGRCFVRGEIVQDHDVTAPQMSHQVATDPRDKADAIHGAPRRGERQPAVDADGAYERQIVSPVDRSGFNEHGSAGQPGVRPPHREIRAGFVQKDEASRIYSSHPASERRPLGLDRRTIVFRGACAFFLKTHPVRCSARRMLDRCTRASGAASRLYARVNSSVVRSGFSWTSRCSNGRSIGDSQPPALAKGASVPVSRERWTQRTSVARLMPNPAATSVYRAVLSSYARTARSRSAVGYGLGMHVIDHKTILNSSELWD
jgi:hypothetical protein